MIKNPKVRRALISVTDKTGIVDFAHQLQDEFGVEIVSTGGTARVLSDAGIKVIPIEKYTGFPEMMDGRVKTLHPIVHGGLLARRDSEKHMAEAREHGIGMIDLVVVNLYQFEETVSHPGVTFADAIEHIDIGGPSMLRSAAKNNDSVTVICDPDDYGIILDEMRSNDGATTLDTRRRCAAKVYTKTAAYDGAISSWLNSYLEGKASAESQDAPDTLNVHLTKQQDLRYGENPHQQAAFYRMDDASPHSLVNAKQLNGKPLSYNNILDTDAAWTAVREFTDPAVIVLKHQNPCGSAIGHDVTEAYDRAFACDPKSAFGGIIAVNRTVEASFVEHIFENKQFVEVIIAPDFSDQALDLLKTKKNLRILMTGGIDHVNKFEYRSVDGGVLLQSVDRVVEDPASFTVPTKVKPTDEQMVDLLFAWRVCKTVKSNAVLIAKNQAGIGMGPGQPNRVDSIAMACKRAHEVCDRVGMEHDGMVVASDAFFPFRDSIDVLAQQGIKAVIQPGGSIRDQEVIDACDEHGIAMVFTGVRHFRH